MTILLATTADLRRLIQEGGSAAQRREQNARLRDNSVSGIQTALDAIPTDGPVTDKTVGAIAGAEQTLRVLAGESYKDTSVGGHQRAFAKLEAQDPLGERQLPQLRAVRARVRDKSVGEVNNAAKVIDAADGAALRDKTIGATQDAKKVLVAAALELLQ